MINVSSSELDKAIKEVVDARVKMLKAMRDTLIEQLNHAITILSTYPPETGGNRPPPPYWQRDYGQIGRGGNLVVPSQHLTKSWIVNDQTDMAGVYVSAKTDVTYAPYVIGSRHQSRIHEQNGWPKVREALNQVGLAGADEFVNGEITPPSILQERIAAIESEINSITQ